jgi:hypothetical protein
MIQSCKAFLSNWAGIAQKYHFQFIQSIFLKYLLHISLFYVPQFIYVRNSNSDVFMLLDLSGVPLIYDNDLENLELFQIKDLQDK